MSGSGSGSYMPSSKSSFDCNLGTITTTLVTIDVEVLNTVTVGDILEVSLENNAVIVENPNGEMLGSVIHANIDELKECIEKGNTYSAEIISIIGINCKVTISKI